MTSDTNAISFVTEFLCVDGRYIVLVDTIGLGGSGKYHDRMSFAGDWVRIFSPRADSQAVQASRKTFSHLPGEMTSRAKHIPPVEDRQTTMTPFSGLGDDSQTRRPELAHPKRDIQAVIAEAWNPVSEWCARTENRFRAITQHTIYNRTDSREPFRPTVKGFLYFIDITDAAGLNEDN
ncbi:hypothetical protein DL96DRAFT_1824520, partial [Flagelloscypha sp. PMI_526]